MARPLTREFRHQDFETRTGRLDTLFGHGALKGRLWEPDGPTWTCHFKREHLPILRDAWMRTVTVTGRIKGREHDSRELMVESVSVNEPRSASTGGDDFFKPVSLEELARRQGVGPVQDVEALFARWPADDDPDEFLKFIMERREQARKTTRERLP